MLATPIRWVLMFLVAGCGYFIITSDDYQIRAAAFIFSVLCWQLYYITMMYEADSIRSSGLKKKAESEKGQLNHS
ncbi:MAG: hypothetical protein N3F07_00225 [Candidatus Micrarchaeota archaeon]|nr:hypothetical protein [Candidatus Micrarchaeota archaeon]